MPDEQQSPQDAPKPQEAQTPDQAANAPQAAQDAPQGWRNEGYRESDESRDEMRAQLAEMQKRLDDAERDKQQAIAGALAQSRGERPAPAVKVDLSEMDQAERAEKYADWPEQGGSELPQPWDHRRQGLHTHLRDFEENARPGSPNTVSPIVVSHSKPILTHGSADPSVHELGRILGALGFHNSVSEGANAYGAVDNSIMAAVHSFRDAYGVQEDPSGWGGDTPDGRNRAAAHIGPWTWEAILRVGKRLARELVA